MKLEDRIAKGPKIMLTTGHLSLHMTELLIVSHGKKVLLALFVEECINSIYWRHTCHWDVCLSVSKKQHLNSPLKRAVLIQGSVTVVCTSSSPPPCYNCAIVQSVSTLKFRYMHYQTATTFVWDICCQTVKLKGWCKDSQQADLGAEVSFNTLPGGHDSALYGKLFLLWRCQTTVHCCFSHIL